MVWTKCLLALLVTAVVGNSEQAPAVDWVNPLVFPDGSLPELVPSYRPAVRAVQARSDDCPANCALFQKKKAIDPAWRLSGDIIPSTYKLKLNVDVDKFLFNGAVNIEIKANTVTNNITLHSDGLTLNSSSARVTTGINNAPYAQVKNITEDKDHLTVTLNLDKALALRKKYNLFLEFSGEIRKDLHGFYRSSYKVGNETRWLATTQFEPTHARRAFPCFDEPNLKADFAITITHDKKYRAISNMPIESSQTNGDLVTDNFEVTEPMSTYLIAFIISDFKNYTGNTPRSNVWATEELINDAKYTQEIGLQVLEKMENYTGIPFSLPKMDHAAIPDFSAGAMENWGLITYRDYLVIKRNDTGISTKQFINTVIAHEIAHQWFGDLVTLDWWSFTWLNEGFATYFENYITEKLTGGDWALWDQFISAKFQVALDLDGTERTSIPMTSNVSSPSEIGTKFDQISYGKGGCVLRMFSEILSANVFQTGLQRYLTERQYQNAVPDHLFAHLEKVANESNAWPKDFSFTAFAKSWTEQDGVPVVTALRDYETGEVTLTQKRFYDQPPSCNCSYDRQWWIPISWHYRNQTGFKQRNFKVETWLRGDVKNQPLVVKTEAPPAAWLMLNVRSVGYFRVNYDTRNWMLLTAALNSSQLKDFAVANRAQIIHDAYSLASVSELDFATAMNTLVFLSKERNTAVWMSGVKILGRLLNNIGPTPAYPLFEEFSRGLIDGSYGDVRLTIDENEPHLQSLLRYYISPFACLFGVENCLKDAVEKFEAAEKNKTKIHTDINTATLCGAFRAVNETRFWEIRNSIKTVTQTAARSYLTSAIPCSNNKSLVKAHLEEGLKPDSEFPKDMFSSAIYVVITAPSKYRVGFEFLRDNFDATYEKIGKAEMRTLARALIDRTRTRSDYKELCAWLQTHLDKFDEPEKLMKEWEDAKGNYAWNEQYLAEVTDWLAATLGKDRPDGIPRPEAGSGTTVAHVASFLTVVALSIIAIIA